MTQSDNFSAIEALKILRPLGIEAAIIVPTPTGLEKSILDATDGLRSYLSSVEYHDYDSQPLGREGRIQRDGVLVNPEHLENTTVSMYRPATKSGDPRIWLGKAIHKYVSPLNILAVTIINDRMYVLNMSNPEIRESLKDEDSPFRKIVDKNKDPQDSIYLDANFLSQRMPLAEDVFQDPISGTFDVFYKNISKPGLFSATLSQVSDAIEDVLANASNSLKDDSLDIKKLKRTLSKYASDPQRVEMDFTTVHRSLTIQVGTEVLPASDEIEFLILALKEAAQGIRATNSSVAENRKILQQQAIHEISTVDLDKITDAAPVLEAITKGDLHDQMKEDVILLEEVNQEAKKNDGVNIRTLPGVTRDDAIIAGSDEVIRVLGRSSRMLMAIRKSPSFIKDIHEGTPYKVANITSTLVGLVKTGLELF